MQLTEKLCKQDNACTIAHDYKYVGFMRGDFDTKSGVQFED